MRPVSMLVTSAAIAMISAHAAFASPSGAELFTRKGCVGCHTLKGHPGADGQLGPDLSKVHKDGQRDELIAWIRDPQALKPGSRMPSLGLSQKETEALADYLLSARPRKGKRR